MDDRSLVPATSMMPPPTGDPTGNTTSDPSGATTGSRAGSTPSDPAGRSPLSALPSRAARALAFAAILIAGAAGALIGWAFVDVQCTGDCSTPTAIGALVGGLFGAVGTAVVAVLVLRAMGEWRELGDRRATERPTPGSS